MTTIRTRLDTNVRLWLGVGLLGAVLGLIGPYGSYFNGGAVQRIVYWTGAMWLGLALFGGALAWTARRLGAGPRRVGGLIVAILLAAIPHALLTRWIAVQLWPTLDRVGPSIGVWYLQGLGIALPVGLLYAYAKGWLTRPQPADDEPMPVRPGEAPLLARVPARLGRDIQCLKMEDHYVRVCTAEGSALLLMPLSQAMAEIAPLAGMQTHRSWWVARDAVADVDVTARTTTLHLRNGMEAPVARTAVAKLRAAGWLPNR